MALGPCPFCGHFALVAPPVGPKQHEDAKWYRVICLSNKGGCGAKGPKRKSVAEAIEAWNTRVERTCHQVITDCNDGLMPPFTAHCSECGDEWGYTPKYCPNCGAKVVFE